MSRTDPKETCENCRYFEKVNPGFCHLYPKMVIKFPADWCGQFQEVPKLIPEKTWWRCVFCNQLYTEQYPTKTGHGCAHSTEQVFEVSD